MSFVHFVVYGKPSPAGSKTVGFNKAGKHFVRDSAKNAKDWKRAVAAEAGACMVSNGVGLLEGPLTVDIHFYLPRPKGHYGARGLRPSAPTFPTVKPDVLKLARAVEDACTGIVWRDDAQIVAETISKEYGDPVRAVVNVWARHETPKAGLLPTPLEISEDTT